MTKNETKQLARARVHGRGALLIAMAQIHRAGSKRTRNEIDQMIEQANCWADFVLVNGALLHRSEA